MAHVPARRSVRILAAVVRGVYGLPRPVRRLLAGRAIQVDGQDLALDAQLLIRLDRLAGGDKEKGTVAEARQQLEDGSALVGGPAITAVAVRDIDIPIDVGTMRARLYTPHDVHTPSPLLVYFHGGGWVVGSLDTHDNLCRRLACDGDLRVLSVDYRLAPEHRFPTAAHDALAAFRFAVDNAVELGATPSVVAVGGDSAGGNLAASVSYQTARRGSAERPVFQLLIYPATDLAGTYPSHDLFATGFLLTRADMDWYKDHYCPDVDRRKDPVCSPLLADDLSGMPPTYIVAAGFDPLRDEGEAYAGALRAAGISVDYRLQSDLVHGFVNMTGIGHRFGEATAEMIGALRAALAVVG